jgi:hypothetical protein
MAFLMRSVSSALRLTPRSMAQCAQLPRVWQSTKSTEDAPIYGGVDIPDAKAAAAHSEDIDVNTWSAQSRHPSTLSNLQILKLIDAGKIKLHKLEHDLNDATRAVEVRRQHLSRALTHQGVGSEDKPAVANLPYKAFNERSFYDSIQGYTCVAELSYYFCAGRSFFERYL